MTTCFKCGGEAPGYYWMGDLPACKSCLDTYRREYKLARKQQLDAMPRCEIDGCNRRAKWKMIGVGLCGFHKKRVDKQHKINTGSAGIMGLFMASTYTKAAIIEMAKKT